MNRHRIRFVTAMFGWVAVSPFGSAAFSDDAATSEVRLRDLVLKVPAGWKLEDSTSRLRLGQFRIPAVEGDEKDAELTIFSFGGSDVADNIRRWVSQFAPDDRKVAIFSGEAAQGKYLFVELSGTYNEPVGPPIEGKTQPAPGSRVLAVILVVPEKGVYYLKMVGLDNTVAAQANALRAAFGGDASKETEIKLDS